MLFLKTQEVGLVPMHVDVHAFLRAPERDGANDNTYVPTVLGASERDDNRCTSRS